MKRTLILLLTLVLTLVVVGMIVLFIHSRSSITISRTDCSDIVASPDYLQTGSEHDAIAAINNARQVEHLRPLQLPHNFYQLDPSHQQFLLLNLERTDRGLKPLQLDANLAQLALAYSKQLRNLNFFAHTSPIGGTFSERVTSQPGLNNHYSQAAENLAGNPVPGIGPMYEYMYDDSIENCGHRHNILNPALTQVGIGWVNGGAYGSMSTQEFIASAPWNPYQGATPDTIPPHISIAVSHAAAAGFLQCQAFASDNVGVVRITWFLDKVDKPLQVGPSWILNIRHLSPGKHTLYVFAVDGEQNYAEATDSFTG